VGVKPNTSKSRESESSGTPECSELDSKAQNTSPWGVLGVIGKVLKCRCPKWPRIGHLDICSPSYGQKKGRESNWQFDSRPLKVGIDLFPTWSPGVRHGVGNFSLRAIRLVQTSLRSEVGARSYGCPKSRESNWDTFGTISGLHFGSPGNLCHLDVAPTGRRRVYYREYGGGKGVPNAKLTSRGWFLDVDSYKLS
jgi:hypothetical protein